MSVLDFQTLTHEEKVRFYSQMDRIGNCHVWTGYSRKGYGRVSIRGKMHTVTHVAWGIVHGPIPEGMDVLHNCLGGDNSLCCNPNHLWLGTDQDNATDKVNKGRWKGNIKLSPDDILAILAMRKTGKFSQAEIATKFKVTGHAIHMIVTGQVWQGITGITKETVASHNPHRRVKGEQHCSAKLTENNVAEIKSLWDSGQYSQNELGNKFGVNQSVISRVVNNHCWKSANSSIDK